jgi:hypothetical protein
MAAACLGQGEVADDGDAVEPLPAPGPAPASGYQPGIARDSVWSRRRLGSRDMRCVHEPPSPSLGTGKPLWVDFALSCMMQYRIIGSSPTLVNSRFKSQLFECGRSLISSAMHGTALARPSAARGPLPSPPLPSTDCKIRHISHRALTALISQWYSLPTLGS